MWYSAHRIRETSGSERMIFSERTDWPLGGNELAGLLADKKRRGEDVFDLTESNPTRCGFRYPSITLSAPVYEPDPKGLLSARAALARYYSERGESSDAQDFILTSGTSEGYQFLFRLLAQTEEAVACPIPSYPLFEFLCRLNDLTLVPYRLIYDGSWRIDAESLEKAFNQCRIRAVLSVNPNNPTGHFLSEADAGLLSRLCEKKGAAIISDEVFSDFSFFENARVVSTPAVLTFSLNGFSKMLGLPQMKLSWIRVQGPAALKKEALRRLEIIADTYLSVGTPIQRAVPELLKEVPGMRGQILSRIRSNRRHAEEMFGPSLLHAEGGWYAVLRTEGRDDETVALELLERQNVYVHPGYFFDFDEPYYLVLSLLPPPDRFNEGLLRLARFLKA